MSPSLSTRALNRALLARQLLLERSPLPLPRAVERVGGIQAQYAPSTYVGLWSRVADLERAAVTRALERGQLVQGTLMRATIHVVSKRDFVLFSAGVGPSRREWWFRVNRDERGVDMEAVAGRVRVHLAGGPLRANELAELLAADGFPEAAIRSSGLCVPLVRVPPSGTWERRRADLIGLADDVTASEEEGLEHVVKRYLAAFGPASADDVASWSGVPVTKLRPAIERVAKRRFRDAQGGELLDVGRAPLPDPDTPAPVRFLPTWDAILLVHARRTQILPERYRERIFSIKTPHSVGTFLVDGAVAGTWRHDGDRIGTEPFERLPREARRELDDEAERLRAFHS